MEEELDEEKRGRSGWGGDEEGMKKKKKVRKELRE